MFSDVIREGVLPIVLSFPFVSPRKKEQLVAAMVTCYHSMVASEPLLRLAANIGGEHQEYFARHEEEERGHEKWMIKDIAALGGVIGAPPPPIVTMCGEMYYKVRHVSPSCLLGYMGVIEGFPSSPEAIAELKACYPEASHTLAYHAENDREHILELNKELNRVSEREQYLVYESAIRTASLYADALWLAYSTVEEK